MALADVGRGGDGARGDDSVAEGVGGGDSDVCEGGVAPGEPGARGSGVFFSAGEGAGAEDDEREVGGEGVVLLIGRDGEEDQDEGGVESEEPVGAGAEFGSRHVAGGADEVGFLNVEVDGAAAGGAEVVEPVFAGLPGAEDEDRGEEAPRGEPDEVEGPVEVAGELVVVVGVAGAKEAEEMFVEEVEVEEAVDVSG